ncbi:hypothetical protein [Pedobacter sp. MR22-3]|uniref:hypothetical protein n=1 Tax=Pedobacter TaxID=84567 RepID=UPI002247FB9E|nr:hypothetical protein [Pedobacter sp. MR22-3]MCX2582281.1 hypothetical protein [Pedobacter sp. MR22-3]
MNNTFNFNRFGLLVKRQWMDFGKIYLGTLIVLAGIIFAFYSYFIPSTGDHNILDHDGNLDMRFRYGLFLMLGFLFISITSSTYFNNFGQKSRAIHELMIPASTFEKFMVGIFYTVVVTLFGYLLVFYLIDLGFVKYLNANLSAFKSAADIKTPLKMTDGLFDQVMSDQKYLKYCSAFFAFPFLVISLFLLGSIYFNRFHYIKTAVSVVVFTYAGGYLIYKTGDLLTRNMTRINLHIKEIDVLTWIFLVSAIITLILWFITYIRLKEKEV